MKIGKHTAQRTSKKLCVASRTVPSSYFYARPDMCTWKVTWLLKREKQLLYSLMGGCCCFWKAKNFRLRDVSLIKAVVSDRLLFRFPCRSISLCEHLCRIHSRAKTEARASDGRSILGHNSTQATILHIRKVRLCFENNVYSC